MGISSSIEMFQSGGSVGTAPQACTCQGGYYCPAGSTTATGIQCPSGSFCTGGTANASQCPVGSFCPPGSSAKTDCTSAGGYYCPLGSTTTAGVICPAGSYCAGTTRNAVACTSSSYYCPQGSILNNATNCIRTVSTLSFYLAVQMGGGQNLAISNGQLYITDMNNNRIIQTSTGGGYASVYAGGEPGSAQDGTATGYQGPYGYIGSILSSPTAICVADSGTVYFIDGDFLRKITNSSTVTTITSSGLSGPMGIAVDSNETIYIADTNNNRIRKATSGGTLSLLAGSGIAGAADGTGAAAQFNQPQGIAVDSAGNVYVADTGNHRIRKITSTGVVTTIAGSTAGYSDGYGTQTQFYTPTAIAVDSAGSLYVADSDNQVLRKLYLDTCDTQLRPSNGTCYPCIVGSSTDPYCSNATQTRVFSLTGVVPISVTLKIVAGQLIGPPGGSNAAYSNINISPYPAPAAYTGYSYTWALTGGATSAKIVIPSSSVASQSMNFSNTGTLPTSVIFTFYLNSSTGVYTTLGTATMMISPSWPATYSSPSVWNVTTFAGSSSAGYNNGTVKSSALNKSQQSIVSYNSTAGFGNPAGIVVDSSFTLYITDSTNTIRKITQPQACNPATGL